LAQFNFSQGEGAVFEHMEAEFGRLNRLWLHTLRALTLSSAVANAWLDTLGEIKERSGDNNE
jgi:hypothetical protein